MKLTLHSIIYILFAGLSSTLAARILLVPGNVNSHVLYFNRMAEALAEVGHRTDVYMPSNTHQVESNINNTNFNMIRYQVSGDHPYSNSPDASQLMMQIALSRSMIEKFQFMVQFGMKLLTTTEVDCVDFMNNKVLQKKIREARYDFAIMDGLAMNCYHALPYSLGIPYATLSVASSGWVYRIPQFPSFSSTLGYTDRMTFSERLTTLLTELAQLLTVINSNTTFSQIYAPDKPPQDMIQFFVRSSLWIIIEDLSLGYPRPHMPNTVGIGDLMAGQPLKPLPSDLQKYIDDASESVVLVSFGSFFDFVPREIAEKFCNVFRSMKYRFIWKLKMAEYCPGASNVKIMPWVPQNDLLAADKIKLFISHAGFNSLAEALYHAKPVIAFPIALDQPGNAAAVHAKGFAIRMDLADFTESELRDNINRILTDQQYLRIARQHSAIFKDKQLTPGQRVSYLINHIIKFGDSHLRTGAYELNAFQYFMIDLFAFIFVTALVSIAILCVCCKCACRRIGKRCCRNSNTSREKKND